MTRPALAVHFPFGENGVNSRKVSSDITDFVSEVWHDKPIIVILAIGAFIIFVLLVINTYRHRKKEKKRHPKKH
ncbi:MAG TPA: hypothetical protein VMD27_09390 [Candidatus Aquilonibacter sp.]|nr:hypothetical protein [Candidatus Aquilonibacter sp.]